MTYTPVGAACTGDQRYPRMHSMTRYSQHRGIATLALGTMLLTGACGKEQQKPETPDDSKKEAAEGEHKETGRVIVVEAYSDGAGNYFKPSEIEAHRGDIVRFMLKSGVHNINFLPDSNAGKTNLPPASELLQLPEQTHDLKVTLAEGRYYFQCDPHAALGMKGHLKVED